MSGAKRIRLEQRQPYLCALPPFYNSDPALDLVGVAFSLVSLPEYADGAPFRLSPWRLARQAQAEDGSGVPEPSPAAPTCQLDPATINRVPCSAPATRGRVRSNRVAIKLTCEWLTPYRSTARLLKHRRCSHYPPPPPSPTGQTHSKAFSHSLIAPTLLRHRLSFAPFSGRPPPLRHLPGLSVLELPASRCARQTSLPSRCSPTMP